jgi:hypothetical protein
MKRCVRNGAIDLRALNQHRLQMDGLAFEKGADTGEPATHAFIVGVGDYPWISNVAPGYPAQLSSTVNSARVFYDWIMNQYKNSRAPLRSVRLLLSPSQGCEATLANFVRHCSLWAQSLSTNKENVGIFLFSGHGMGLGFDRRILALHDFGKFAIAPFQGSVSLDNIYAGLAPSERLPNISRKQFYFIDAGALPASVLTWQERNAAHIFAIPPSSMVDDREAPLFFSASSGGLAWGRSHGLSLFTEALLACLEGQGSERLGEQWVVTSLSLTRGLQYKAREETDIPSPLSFTTSGSLGTAVLHELTRPPIVPLTIRSKAPPTIEAVDTEAPIDRYKLIPTSPSTVGTYTVKVPAGIYTIVLPHVDRPAERRTVIVYPPATTVSFP